VQGEKATPALPDVVRIALVRFRWEIVSQKQTSKGQTTNRAYQCKLVVYTNSDDGPGRRIALCLVRRSASPIQPQITNY